MTDSFNQQDIEYEGFKIIGIDDLRVGMYIKLDLPWVRYPFTRKQYKISNEKEISNIKKYGIQKLVIDTEKSDLSDSDKKKYGKADNKRTPRKKRPKSARRNLTQSKLKTEGNGQIEKKIRKLETSKNAYHLTCGQVDDIFNDISSNTKKGLAKSQELVTKIANEIEKDEETFVHLINLHFKKEFIQFHSLNVCLLSLILGKTLRLPREELTIVGLGALFHDIGKTTLPVQLITKKTPYSRIENSVIMTHCQRGREIFIGRDDIPPQVPNVVFQHHEYVDGSGYPNGIKGEDIQTYSKIVGVANIYENLTNPFNLENMMLPHQALSYMYKHMKDKLTPILVETLVKSLGVYPPGSVVELNNGAMGMVLSINRLATLKPTVLLSDSKALSKTPTILDLNDDHAIKIVKALKLSDLSKEAIEGLKLDKRKGYSTTSDEDARNV